MAGQGQQRGKEMAGWTDFFSTREDAAIQNILSSWANVQHPAHALLIACLAKKAGYYSVRVNTGGDIVSVFFGPAEKQHDLKEFVRGMMLELMEEEGLVELRNT